jgi:zinc transport system substrate-binding protein
MLRKKIISILLLLFLFSLDVNAKVKVITTIKPLADIFREIGKDKVSVDYVIPPNISFHIYEYKISDINKVRNADIFVYIGSGEPKAERLAKITKGQIIKVGNLIPENLLIRTFEIEEHHHHLDIGHNDETFHPAVWLDPRLSIIIANGYYKTLIKIDPKNKEFYYKNYSQFVLKSVNLYTKWKDKFDKLNNKNFISYHYLYPYLTRAFGLNYLAVVELGHGRKPTIKHILHLSELIRKKNIKYIFASLYFFNPKYLDLLKKGGVKIIYLDPLGVESKNYFETMNNLLEKIYRGLK